MKLLLLTRELPRRVTGVAAEEAGEITRVQLMIDKDIVQHDSMDHKGLSTDFFLPIPIAWLYWLGMNYKPK